MKSSNNDTVHTDTLASNAAKYVYNQAVLAVRNRLSSAVDLKTKNIIFKCIVTVVQDRTTAIEAQTEMLLQFTKQENIHQLLAIKAQQGKQSQSDDGSAWLDNNLRKQITKILNVENGMKLLEAIEHGSLSDVAKLLDKKDNIELTVKNHLDENAVHVAVIRGECEILKLVLKDLNSAINSQNWRLETALHRAPTKEIAELLIANKANVDAEDNTRRKPLHRASTKEIAELLIANKATVDAKDNTGKTALHYVKKPAIAKVLIDNGANVNALDHDGCTALHYVRNSETAKVLIDNGAVVNQIDYEGSTALHNVNDLETIKVLLDHGAKINQTNKKGNTPLMCLGKEDIEIANLLIAKGADTTVKNDEGKTALEIANAAGYVDIVEVIKARLEELNNQSPVELMTNDDDHLQIAGQQEEVAEQAEEQIDTVNALGNTDSFNY